MTFLITFISLLIQALTLAIFARVIISWVDPTMKWRISQFIRDLTEPLLGPVRKLLPSTGMLDLSPLIVLMLLQLIKSVVLGG